MNDYTYLILYILLGLPVLYQSYLASKYDKKNNYWTNNGKNKINQPFYKFSLLLVVICSIYLLYYLTTQASDNTFYGLNYDESKYIFYVSIITLLGFSLMWVPTIMLKHSTNAFLFFVSLSSLLLFITLLNADKRDNIAIAAAFYLFFHTFVLDAIFWTGIIKI